VTEWEQQYAAAWQTIADGLGFPFNQHLTAARRFVGDAALLALMDQFEPTEVIIGCGIGIANIVLEDVSRHFGNRHRRSQLERAIGAAHAIQAQTADGQAFIAETKAQRDDAEREFLNAAADDARFLKMRAWINQRRRADGLPPL
jgi:hypothetical protein